MTRSHFAAVVAAVFTASFAVGTASADPVKIRADWISPTQFAPFIPTLPQYAPNVYRHYGKSYVVEPVRLQGGGATLTALASGNTDLSTLAPQGLVLGVVEAKLEIRVIGQQFSTEVPGYFQTYFWAYGSEIKRVEDLRGKIIGVNARASNIDTAAHIVMANHGLSEPRDYRIAEVPFPAVLPSLQSKKIDVGVLTPAFRGLAKIHPELKPVFSVGDAFGAVETLMWIAKADFVMQNRAALVDLLEDNMRMRRWMFDPKTRMDALRQLSDLTKVPIAQYVDWAYLKGEDADGYYDPHAMVNIERLQKNINTMRNAGVVPATIPVEQYVDMSLAKEAAARLEN